MWSNSRVFRITFVIAFCLLSFLGVSASSCDFHVGDAKVISKTQNQMQATLQREHELHKMTSDSYFLIFGDTRVLNYVSSSMKFAWKMNGNIYQISSLPLEKVRLNFDPNVKIPTIKFDWDQTQDCTDIQFFMENTVDFATITLSESDWSPQISVQQK